MPAMTNKEKLQNELIKIHTEEMEKRGQLAELSYLTEMVNHKSNEINMLQCDNKRMEGNIWLLMERINGLCDMLATIMDVAGVDEPFKVVAVIKQLRADSDELKRVAGVCGVAPHGMDGHLTTMIDELNKYRKDRAAGQDNAYKSKASSFTGGPHQKLNP